LIATMHSDLMRTDVAAAFPSFPQALHSGFDGQFEIGALDKGVNFIDVFVQLPGGTARSLLMRRLFYADQFKQRWIALLNDYHPKYDDIFYIPIATSLVANGGANGIQEIFSPFESRTVKIGMRVQILYLRTTLGAGQDYVFDPDFVADKWVGSRLIAEDGLNSVIHHAVEHRLPTLFTLNGGIWADSACEAIEWDVNDALELDESLCQWNEKNQVMPDTALSNLPGSVQSPELGRSLSLNVYMHKVRYYKKRNLQHAAGVIARFANEHPDLFIGVNLDPDVYINPFYIGDQWYDYNPGTLKQFRHWLRADGPYQGEQDQNNPDVPDLSKYRRSTPLTLADIDALTGRRHTSWEQVDPPRKFPPLKSGRPFWKNAWVAVWDQFRRHLVQLHYDELSQWVAQMGISPDHIYSSQGFMPPDELIDPLPVRLDSPTKNYDAAGVSIEGAVPSHGHLGVIIYGQSCVNDVRMEGTSTLFAEFRKYSPKWAVVECNTADLNMPHQAATLSQGYTFLREVTNYNACLISPMAWNGSPGEAVGTSGFRSYTSLRRSPLEIALSHLMLARADLPRRARLWTFGALEHPDGDGWLVDGKAVVPLDSSKLILNMGQSGTLTLTSPNELAFKCGDYRSLVIQADTSAHTSQEIWQLQVHGLTIDGRETQLSAENSLHSYQDGDSLYVVTLTLPNDLADQQPEFQQLRLTWSGSVGTDLIIRAIVLYPVLPKH
jgi:hypothetical protein